MASVSVVASDLQDRLTSPTSGRAQRAFLFGRRLSAAEFLWLAFVVVQALDGVFSYVGVSLHGPAIEGNPLVGWYLAAFGPAVGFTLAKLFAVTCGAVLYVTANHRWVALLTLLYVVFAVGPWARLLTQTA